MRVLVLNPGSSTLKYRLFDVAGGEARPLGGGLVERVAGGTVADAARELLAQASGVEAVGCRVVHGGPRFQGPTRVNAEVRAAVRELGRFAPLHNPVAADILDAVDSLLPGVPVVAVFDTAFHATLPEVAWRYAIPREMGDRGLRRYGFHGTSHQYVSRRLRELTGGDRLIVCHLDNGASVCAVRDGTSIDTSMGLTPLEGLVMGTRCGDLGPDLVLHLLRGEGLSPEAVDDLLNRKSGLLGLCGASEMRDIQARGDDTARLALDLFSYRLRKYIGAYAAALEGVDAIAFTGGIGEHSPDVRALVCGPLGWLGVRLDEGANRGVKGEGRITRADSPVAAWVIPTDEEREIALQVAGVPGERRA